MRVRAGGNGRGPGLGSTGQLLEVGDESLLMQAVSQQLTMAINHYCVVQKSLVFPPTPLLCSASIRSHFFSPSTAELELGGQVIRVLLQHWRVGDGQPFDLILFMASSSPLGRKQHACTWEWRGLWGKSVGFFFPVVMKFFLWFFLLLFYFGFWGGWSLCPVRKGEPQCLVLQSHATKPHCMGSEQY